jgi:hypothetical protein
MEAILLPIFVLAIFLWIVWISLISLDAYEGKHNDQR